MSNEENYLGNCWLCKEDVYKDRTESIRVNNYDITGVLKETYVFHRACGMKCINFDIEMVD